eukprot:2599180-Rhodomonas_salina.7
MSGTPRGRPLHSPPFRAGLTSCTFRPTQARSRVKGFKAAVLRATIMMMMCLGFRVPRQADGRVCWQGSWKEGHSRHRLTLTSSSCR